MGDRKNLLLLSVKRSIKHSNVANCEAGAEESKANAGAGRRVLPEAVPEKAGAEEERVEPVSTRLDLVGVQTLPGFQALRRKPRFLEQLMGDEKWLSTQLAVVCRASSL